MATSHKLSPERLAQASSRHPWVTLVSWLLAVVIGFVVSGALLGKALTTEGGFINDPESKQAQQLVEDNLGVTTNASEVVIVHSDTATIDEPRFESYVSALGDRVSGLGPDTVESVASYFDTQDPAMASEDGRSALVMVTMAGAADEMTDRVPRFLRAVEAGQDPAFRAQVFGEATASEELMGLAEEDMQKGEGLGLLVALAVLILVFGAVVAGIVPVVIAMFSIVISLGILGVVGTQFQFSFFVTNMVSMMGLAVGIDYSLFIISRYREERAKGYDKHEAIGRAGATANRAVFFSGTVVVLALIGMFIVPSNIFVSLAAGAISVVVVAVLASMTLLPAVLSLLGDRVDALRIRRRKAARTGGPWATFTRGVMRRPVVSVVLVGTFLLAAASPYFLQAHPDDAGHGLKRGSSGISTLPDDLRTKQAFESLSHYFAGGMMTPAEVVIQGDVDSSEVAASVETLQQRIAADPSFGPSQPIVSDEQGDLAVLRVPLAGAASDPESDAAVAAVKRLRQDYVPQAFGETSARVLIGGATASSSDFIDMMDVYTPWIFALVLGLSFVLLTVVFRSIVVPVKAILMNLLSVGAAYGLMVLVFQKGGPELGRSIADALNFTQVQSIEPWLPLFLFSVLFGLSMDYHLFLLTRIREEYDRTGDNSEAVAFGLQSTASIITGAALIMVTVFGSFAAGHMSMLQQMGFGLAVAVFLDATIVRSVLVPASMKLLGDANWYLPSWLGWLPRLNVEGHVEDQIVRRSVLEIPQVRVREPVRVD
jgi:putative drug exporter of the RND superfamily